MIFSQKFLLFFVCILCLVRGLSAQVPPAPQEPEVRRAIPLATSNSTLQPEETLPVEHSVQNIRLAPAGSSDPVALAEAQLTLANGLFADKKLPEAVIEYEKFLQMTSPGQPYRAEALFRLWECHRKLHHQFACRFGAMLGVQAPKPQGDP